MSRNTLKKISKFKQKEKRRPTSTAETNTFYGEQITNGGFETGNLNGWTHHAGSVKTLSKRTGTWGAYIGYIGDYIQQTLNVPVDGITSFSLWFKWLNTWPSNFDVIITYSDTSTTTISRIGLTAWQEVDILPLLDAGKTITQLKILKTTNNYGLDLDDISLIGWEGE